MENTIPTPAEEMEDNKEYNEYEQEMDTSDEEVCIFTNLWLLFTQ